MRHTRRLAFTLIELLVVVAIIVALLALLVPSLNQAFEVSHRALCATNMNNWGIASLNYAASNNRAFPYNGPVVAGWNSVAGNHISWNSAIVQRWWKDYLLPNEGTAPKDDTHDVLNCPTQTWHQVNDRNWDPTIGAYVAGGGGLVGYFWMPHRDPTNINYAPAGNGWVSKTRIAGPDSRAPIMSDMKQYSTAVNSWYYAGGTYSSHARTRTGEAEGGNFLFEDGHVSWFDSDETDDPNPNDAKDLMKIGATMNGWNFYYNVPTHY